MERIVPYRPLIAAAFSSFLLAACGGGGDDGGGGGSSDGQLSISPSTLTFAADSANGTSIGPKTVTATISGVDVETLYLNVTVTGEAVAAIDGITVTGPTTGTADVYPVSQEQLGAGTYSSTITVIACTMSAACTSGRIGTPQAVDVTYNITGVKASVASLDYQVEDTADPDSSDLKFSVTGYPTQSWTAASSAPWLSLSPDNGRPPIRNR